MERDIDRDGATAQGGDAGTLGGAVEAGGAILGGTGNTAMVDDTASMVGGATGGAVSARDPLSMSTDNTPEGAASADTVEGGPIAQAREGMRVVDAAGEELGTVGTVKMGDPSAITAMGEETGGGGGLLGGDGGGLLGGGDEPDVPDPFRHELVRVGYVRVGGGLFGGALYARADQIAGVSGDTVTLSVRRDQLPGA